MKKIVLIEDRFKRQELFISETNFDFEKYSDIVDNMILEVTLPSNNFSSANLLFIV